MFRILKRKNSPDHEQPIFVTDSKEAADFIQEKYPDLEIIGVRLPMLTQFPFNSGTYIRSKEKRDYVPYYGELRYSREYEDELVGEIYNAQVFQVGRSLFNTIIPGLGLSRTSNNLQDAIGLIQGPQFKESRWGNDELPPAV